MIPIGDIELFVFNDATIWVDPGGPFGLVPRLLCRDMSPPMTATWSPWLCTIC